MPTMRTTWGGGDAILPNVCVCDDEINNVHFNEYIVHALKFTATGASTLGMRNGGGNAPVLEYSYDGAHWTAWDYSTISIADNESVYIRGTNHSGLSSSSSKYSYFTMTGSLACSGNAMWLLDSTQDLDTIPCNYCFYKLFYNCTSLTAAPELPATTLASSCYKYMFDYCTSLTAAPELPATTLASNCYESMFSRCMFLTTAPELPATTLADVCYESMFYSCTNLNNIKVLATSWDEYYAGDWVSGVAATGTFTKKAGVDIPEGESGIPDGWTVVEV